MRAWEDKMVLETTLARNAFQNAYVNARRKKTQRTAPLFKKRAKKADKAVIEQNMRVIKENIKNDGDDWIRAIYAANGKPFPKGTERR